MLEASPIRPISQNNFCALVTVTFFACSSALALANEPDSIVNFDVPALAPVHEVFFDGPEFSQEKTIELVLPISTEINLDNRQNIREFRFDVRWNRDVFPIVDYGPKTQTVSDINGLVSVESSKEKKIDFGLNANGSIEPFSTNGNFDATSRNSERTTFQRVPEHEVLVASGTIARGTGAFFRFHPSKTESLEGGRDLVVAFRVPRQWRAGLLQVQCRAAGERRIVGAWKEPLEIGRSFVVPIYLESDDQGRRSATEFVQSEQNLRRSWNGSQTNHQKKSDNFWPHPIFGNPIFKSNVNQNHLPQDWVHRLIQSGEDGYLNKYQQLLSQEVAVDAGKFVQARKNLLQLNR